MIMEDPSYRGNVVSENRDGKLRMTFPVRAQHLYLMVFGFAFIICAFIEAQVISDVMAGRVPAGVTFKVDGVAFGDPRDPTFLTCWLAAWTVGLLVLAGLFLLSIAGKEIIELDLLKLTRRKRVLGLGRSREYRVAKITELRLAPESPLIPPFKWRSPFGFDNGTVSFNYDREICYLGSGLDAGERRFVIAEMRKKVKALVAD